MSSENNNIIITASNALFYNSVLTLVASIHRESLDLVDQIFVFDLGLKENQRDRLNGLSNVSVVNFPEGVDIEPKQHVYKCYAVHWGKDHGKNIFWLDAGVMLLQSIDEIYNIIDKEEIFLVGDHHLNRDFTHNECREIMSASETELNDVQLSSGILGYKSGGKYQSLINEAYDFSQIDGCVKGDHQRHRHDQSVYSILASRYGCKKYDITRYGYFTNVSRNLTTARENDAVIFVHRNGHWNHKGLRSK